MTPSFTKKTLLCAYNPSDARLVGATRFNAFFNPTPQSIYNLYGHFGLYGGVLGFTIAQLHNVLAAQHFCFLPCKRLWCGLNRSFAHPVFKYETYTHLTKVALA
jgi:hypothetical protein